MKKKLTIYDLAKLADTSTSAVSSILNDNWQKRRISADLADKVKKIAQEQGYTVNRQASMLRSERSRMIGMIVPKYDNRYFGAIAEQFESMARARNLFPIMTCTLRDPALEIEAARELLSYQVECLVATGCTDPDAISSLCRTMGVHTINLDLPGKLAPSVVSDNFNGARQLTVCLLDTLEKRYNLRLPLWFIGGRGSDNNTQQRVKGFVAAHEARGIPIRPAQIITEGYSPDKVETILQATAIPEKSGFFVNSTIALEGFIRCLYKLPPELATTLHYGSFDWDPFAALLPQNVGMIRQNVALMLETVFQWIEKPPKKATYIEIPCFWEK